MENSNNNTGKLIGAILLGTVVGGLLGILFAPDKGSETRKKILSNSDDLNETIKEKLNDIHDEIKHEAKTAKHIANEFMADGHAK